VRALLPVGLRRQNCLHSAPQATSMTLHNVGSLDELLAALDRHSGPLD